MDPIGGLSSTAGRCRRLTTPGPFADQCPLASAHSEESDTPMRRTPFRSGNWAASNSALIDAKAEWSEIGAPRDRLRVMIWKSAYFTLSVTVRPLTPVVSQ